MKFLTFKPRLKPVYLPTYVNTWGPECFRAVIEQMYNQACFAENTGKVIVQKEAPCGSGKSTLVDGITRLSGVEKLINMILMTQQ